MLPSSEDQILTGQESTTRPQSRSSMTADPSGTHTHVRAAWRKRSGAGLPRSTSGSVELKILPSKRPSRPVLPIVSAIFWRLPLDERTWRPPRVRLLVDRGCHARTASTCRASAAVRYRSVYSVSQSSASSSPTSSESRARMASSDSPTNSRMTSLLGQCPPSFLADLGFELHDQAFAVDQHAVAIEDDQIEAAHPPIEGIVDSVVQPPTWRSAGCRSAVRGQAWWPVFIQPRIALRPPHQGPARLGPQGSVTPHPCALLVRRIVALPCERPDRALLDRSVHKLVDMY